MYRAPTQADRALAGQGKQRKQSIAAATDGGPATARDPREWRWKEKKSKNSATLRLRSGPFTSFRVSCPTQCVGKLTRRDSLAILEIARISGKYVWR
jgi:hypothetical protein